MAKCKQGCVVDRVQLATTRFSKAYLYWFDR